MSTDTQVQNNFFIYVNCYLNNNALPPDILEYQNYYSSQFTVEPDSLTGYWTITSWTPTSPTQPSETDLQAITPTQLDTFRRYMDAIILSSNQPIVYQIMFDQQNQIRVLQSLTPYTDGQYKTYISTLPFTP